MRGVTYATGVLAASAAAGPLVVLGTVAAMLPNAGAAGAAGLGGLAVAALFVALPFGFILSLIPNLVGTTLLAAWGTDNIGLRLWPMWALAGAGTGWALDWGLATANGRAEPETLFVLVGVPCALICRWGTRWAD